MEPQDRRRQGQDRQAGSDRDANTDTGADEGPLHCRQVGVQPGFRHESSRAHRQRGNQNLAEGQKDARAFNAVDSTGQKVHEQT